MEPIHAILGASGGSIVGLIVMAVFAIVASAIKKASQARDDQEAERESLRRRRLIAQAAARELAEADEPPPVPRVVLKKAAHHAVGVEAAAKAAHAAKRPVRRESLGTGVEQEMAGFTRHQDQAQAQRQKRLHLAEGEVGAAEYQANLSVSLPGRATIGLHGSAVAQAIVLREILSPPKALRREEEMWEL